MSFDKFLVYCRYGHHLVLLLQGRRNIIKVSHKNQVLFVFSKL